MAKVNRHGKAKIWSKPVIKLLRSQIKSLAQRLIFEISLYTGERMGAIVQLRKSDVYDGLGKVRDTITFESASRKSSKHGLASSRQIYIHPALRVHLENFTTKINSNYLFPSPRDTTKHITARAVDDYWRRILTTHGYYGYSTHSSRRWVINQLRRAGTEISIIAETMAIDIATVRKYLDEDPVACKNAIASLSI